MDDYFMDDYMDDYNERHSHRNNRNHKGNSGFMRDMIRFICVLLVATFGLVACATSSTQQPANTGKLSVVATFSVLADLVQNVTGDSASVITLVGAGSDTHTFEPSPADSVALADASLIFENGASFERWLDDLYTASRSSARRIDLSEGIALLRLGAESHTEAGNGGGRDEVDPHLWHDVSNVMQMVTHIRDSLIESDPANTSLYQQNASHYLAQLQDLDKWIEAEVATIPQDARKLVTTHDTFEYFAHRYGFEVVGTGLSSISTESADPAAADVVALIEEIKRERVPVLFIENVSNPELMQRIATEAGVEVAPALYTDALGAAGSAGDSYIKMMRYNVTTIVDALTQDK